MGCKPSKEAPKTVTPAASSEEAPRPLIFALMRNSHEVIRGGILECKQQLADGNLDGFKGCWAALHKFEHLHMQMEEGRADVAPGFFSILNEHFDGLATKEGLFDAHPKLDAAETLVDEAATAGDVAAVTTAFDAFAAFNEVHMNHEEDIMMPKVMALKKSGHNLKEAMATRILPAAIAGDFEHFVTYGVRMSEKHDGGKPRARVFAHALWGVATDEQWAEWHPWIKAGLSADKYASMAPLFVRG